MKRTKGPVFVWYSVGTSGWPRSPVVAQPASAASRRASTTGRAGGRVANSSMCLAAKGIDRADLQTSGEHPAAVVGSALTFPVAKAGQPAARAPSSRSCGESPQARWDRRNRSGVRSPRPPGDRGTPGWTWSRARFWMPPVLAGSGWQELDAHEVDQAQAASPVAGSPWIMMLAALRSRSEIDRSWSVRSRPASDRVVSSGSPAGGPLPRAAGGSSAA